MKKTLLFALCLMLTTFAKAYFYDFEVDGIYYYVPYPYNHAEVTSGEVSYSGTVTIPPAVTYDGKTYPVTAVDGFEGCIGLEKVILGENVTIIKGRAFKNCTSLSSVNWNDNIVELGGECFWGCTSLTDVVISSNLRTAGVDIFRNCVNLETVTIHDGATVIGQSEFNGCTSLKTIDVPNSVLTIESNAFQGCSNLVAARIGDGVQEISYHVFTDCTRLEKVEMGAGMKSIGMRTFLNCNQLKSITILSPEVPSLVEDGFSNYAATVYVPSLSVSAYKAADNWKKFSSIKAYEEQVYLTIRQASQGSVKMLANIGERYSYDILPVSGWTIHSVTFNNEDVTQQLIGNNYTTPAITSNSILSVVFVEESSDVRSAIARNIRVTTDDNRNIIISEAPYGEPISVYSANGVLLKQTSAENVRTSINMNTHGIYIVKVGDMTVKLNL